jgi:hypothetical protein
MVWRGVCSTARTDLHVFRDNEQHNLCNRYRGTICGLYLIYLG